MRNTDPIMSLQTRNNIATDLINKTKTVRKGSVKDFIPANIAEQYQNCYPDVNAERIINDEFVRFAIDECFYFILGIECMRKASLLYSLDCVCSINDNVFCQSCQRSTMLSQGLDKLTDEEVQTALAWINPARLVEGIKFGKLIDMERIQRLISVQWYQPDIVLLVRPKLDVYMVPAYLQYHSSVELIDRLAKTLPSITSEKMDEDGVNNNNNNKTKSKLRKRAPKKEEDVLPGF